MSAANKIRVHVRNANTIHGVIHHDLLARHCLLDDARHAMGPDYTTAPNLGLLSRLPVELQQQVVLHMDVATVLTWRGVNRMAMDLVSQMFEWKEIIALAPSTLRMAIGIHSQATFRLADLHTALHRRICDTQGCDTNITQYINVKTLARLCQSCFAPHAWRIKHNVSLALVHGEELRLIELFHTLYANERSESSKEIAGSRKVPVTEKMAFVYMGALEK